MKAKPWFFGRYSVSNIFMIYWSFRIPSVLGWAERGFGRINYYFLLHESNSYKELKMVDVILPKHRLENKGFLINPTLMESRKTSVSGSTYENIKNNFEYINTYPSLYIYNLYIITFRFLAIQSLNYLILYFTLEKNHSLLKVEIIQLR